MESTKSITKEFDCRKHPGEKIQRVSSIDGSSVLYCIDCVLAIEDKATKDAVLPIKEFIQRSVAYFEKIKHGSVLQGDIPQDLLAAVEGEDEIISKISTHIEAEKIKVEISFGEIVQTFNTLCNRAKQEILSNLDTQLFNIKYNFRYYKGKLNKFYGKQTESELAELTTETGLFSAINKCESAADLEFLIRQINDEIYENRFLDCLGNSRTEGMSNALKELKNTLKSQGDIMPKTRFSDPVQSQTTIESFQKTMSTFFEEAASMENDIAQLSLGSSNMDSKILTNASEFQMVKNWVVSKGSIKFKLLVRGTRDGFEAATFHKKCDNKKNTLVLVKTDFGKRCGGFTEIVWDSSNNYKQQNNSFLFSIDHKTKFPLKMQQYSIYSHQSYLPCFGGGLDLYLANQCNINNTSYSNFGHSYDAGKFAGNDVKNTLTGGYNFKVTEYEVFEVEGYSK